MNLPDTHVSKITSLSPSYRIILTLISIISQELQVWIVPCIGAVTLNIKKSSFVMICTHSKLNRLCLVATLLFLKRNVCLTGLNYCYNWGSLLSLLMKIVKKGVITIFSVPSLLGKRNFKCSQIGRNQFSDIKVLKYKKEKLQISRQS